MRFLFHWAVLFFGMSSGYPFQGHNSMGYLSLSPSFRHKITQTYHFADRLFQYYGYDDSHAIGHSCDVVKYARDILHFQPSISPTLNISNMSNISIMSKKINVIENEATLLCSFLHDTIDSKYSPETVPFRTRYVRNFLLYDLDYSPSVVKNMMRVMDTISYSKTICNSTFIEPPWLLSSLSTLSSFPAHKGVDNNINNTPHEINWSLVFHTVRQADLLTSYDVERMLQYKYYHLEMSLEEVIDDVFLMFSTRIASLHRVAGLFPSSWAWNESQRLYKLCGIALDILEKEKSSVLPYHFSKFRILDSLSPSKKKIKPILSFLFQGL